EPIPNLRDRRPDVPPALEAVFQRMVAKKPADRYQSMSEVIVALRDSLVGEEAPEQNVLEEATTENDLTQFFAQLGSSETSTAARPIAAAADDTLPRQGESTDPLLVGEEASGATKPIAADPARKKRLLLLLSGGLVGLACAGAVAFMFLRGGRPKQPPHVV